MIGEIEKDILCAVYYKVNIAMKYQDVIDDLQKRGYIRVVQSYELTFEGTRALEAVRNG